jgi:hypothetical protein
LKKYVPVAVIASGLILMIASFALFEFSQTISLKITQAGNTIVGWEIGDSFQASEVLILEIYPGNDWGKFQSGNSPVQINGTLRVNSVEEARFSCWYYALAGTQGPPILQPTNATMVENGTPDFLVAVSNPNGELTCKVKADVNVTLDLDKDSVSSDFGPVNSPPHLRLEKAIFTYPYSHFFAWGLLLVSVGLALFVCGVYASRGDKRARRIKRRRESAKFLP